MQMIALLAKIPHVPQAALDEIAKALAEIAATMPAEAAAAS